MGVINVTPDSFSDGGLFMDPDDAARHGERLVSEGATLLDVGGESTRPGAAPVAAQEQIRRVVPVIERLVARKLPARISIDTSSAAVARAALDAGAGCVNDVTALRADPALVELIAERRVPCCLMHMLGEPRTMQDQPRYDDVVDEVRRFLEERLAFVVAHGIPERDVMLDPGIGFGKTVEHNLQLLDGLGAIVAIGPPVLIGTSRKTFLGRLTGQPTDQRLPGTLATNVIALERGARVFRVHEVAPVRQALIVAAATVRRRWSTTTTS